MVNLGQRSSRLTWATWFQSKNTRFDVSHNYPSLCSLLTHFVFSALSFRTSYHESTRTAKCVLSPPRCPHLNCFTTDQLYRRSQKHSLYGKLPRESKTAKCASSRKGKCKESKHEASESVVCAFLRTLTVISSTCGAARHHLQLNHKQIVSHRSLH